MNRWKAAGLHLLISVVVALIAVVATLGVMYPWTYFRVSGANMLLTILLTVDVAIGPLLTLIVYKKGKPSLKWDLAVIGALQLAALVYGFYVIVQARPVFLVHVGDRFHLVRAYDLEPENLAKGPEERFRTLSWSGPRLAVALKPEDIDRQQELLMAAIGGADLNYFPESYADYEAHAGLVLDKAAPLSELLALAREAGVAAPIERYLARSERSLDSLQYVPLQAGVRFMTALVDHQSGELLTVLVLDPWEPGRKE